MNSREPGYLLTFSRTALIAALLLLALTCTACDNGPVDPGDQGDGGTINPEPLPSNQPRTYTIPPISNNVVDTGLWIDAGSEVHVTSPGGDLIDFGGAVLGMGAPKLNADGDDSVTPLDYPAADLRKNSLICLVGDIWYQGGTDATFYPIESGALKVQPNDPYLADNSRGWNNIVVTVTPP